MSFYSNFRIEGSNPITDTRGCIFSCVWPFYEPAVSDLDKSMHRSLWVYVTHSLLVEVLHTTKNMASGEIKWQKGFLGCALVVPWLCLGCIVVEYLTLNPLIEVIIPPLTPEERKWKKEFLGCALVAQWWNTWLWIIWLRFQSCH